MHVIGIDVGSQSVKALLTDESGAVIATASAPLTMAHPHDGWAEQDPASWEDAIAASVRAACEQAGVPGADVRMLGLACQVDGLVALGDDLRPLRPAIIWLDRRAGRQTDALAAAAGAESLTARTCARCARRSSGSTAVPAARRTRSPRPPEPRRSSRAPACSPTPPTRRRRRCGCATRSPSTTTPPAGSHPSAAISPGG